MTVKVGPYSILDTIGQGGAGVVYRARGPDGRIVALKLLRRTDEVALRRFEREVRLQSGLGAPNGFVPVLDFGSAQGSAYVVLPFLEGGTLRARLKSGTTFGVAETVAIGRTLAKALGQAHALGIVHRDVKPENVIFTHPGGAPLLADLGLAKHYQGSAAGASRSLTHDGTMQGTAGYMSPEQAKDSKSAGPPADVFALGAVLYECLTGKPAFGGDTLVEVLGRVISGEFPPIEEVRKDAPRALAKVIRKALAVDPRARFPEGFAVERALAAAVAEKEPARRSRILALALALVVPSLGVGVAIERLRSTPPVAPSGGSKVEVRRADLERRAYECLLLEDGKGAMAFAEELVALDPRSARGLALRAAAFEHENDLDRARVDADAALALDPRCALALSVRACYATREEALSFANRAVAADPDSPTPYAYRAIQRLSQGDRSGAIADTTRAIALEPRCARAWLLRGALHEGAREHDAAASDATKVVALAPGLAAAWDLRARAHFGLDQLDMAINDATKALGIDPKLSATWIVRAAAHYQKGEHRPAIDDAARGIALAPTNAEAWEVRAVARGSAGDHEGALADATRSLELEPGRPNATTVRAAALSRLPAPVTRDLNELLRAASTSLARAEHRKAIAFATEGIELAPTIAILWSIRGTAHLHVKDFEAAIRDASQAVDLEPDTASALVGRCLARRDGGDVEGGLADASRTIELAPSEPSHWTLRAETRRRRRDFAGAIGDAAHAIWIAPGWQGGWLALANALTEAGRLEAARAALDRAGP